MFYCPLLVRTCHVGHRLQALQQKFLRMNLCLLKALFRHKKRGGQFEEFGGKLSPTLTQHPYSKMLIYILMLTIRRPEDVLLLRELSGWQFFHPAFHFKMDPTRARLRDSFFFFPSKVKDTY